jgi:hypothetical protein
MKMNDVLIAYETRMEDAENTMEGFTDAMCQTSVNYWFPRNPDRRWLRRGKGECDERAMAYPERKMKQKLCSSGSNSPWLVKMGSPEDKNENIQAMCDMYTSPSGTILPEYAHCVKPGGLQYTDCQIACYGYPEQKGCEAIKAMGLSEFQRKKIINSLKFGKPINPPAPATKVNVEATLKSVKPGAIEISYTDPNTQKPTVVTKTLVDMYKPNDSVSVIIAKPAGTFLGFHRK